MLVVNAAHKQKNGTTEADSSRRVASDQKKVSSKWTLFLRKGSGLIRLKLRLRVYDEGRKTTFSGEVQHCSSAAAAKTVDSHCSSGRNMNFTN